MTFRAAVAICTSTSATDAWEYMSAHHHSFIWTDDENFLSAWNKQFGGDVGAVAVKPVPGHEGLLRFSFRDRNVDVQSKFNSDDRLLLLHALGQVVRPESDLRLCRDSTHSSDIAFLAMTPAQWQDLESRVGADRVGAHFLPMNSPYDEFYKAAFPAPDVPRGTLMPDLTDWEGGGSYVPAGLDYTLVYDGPGRPRLDALRAVVHRCLEPGTVTVSFWQSPSKLSVDREMLVESVADRIGQVQIRVSNSSRTGFVVVEKNGVAAGWRIDGWQPRDETPTPWWLFWKR